MLNFMEAGNKGTAHGQGKTTVYVEKPVNETFICNF